ncbi:MAG: sensory protein TspO [Balneola sp.]|jgi:tryptophan-rich sensory protein|nr:sensory protein TspO [Balneola sp.]MBE79305.1 sensory protein TspO [Balneola sp.]HBX66853.1 sensory protein TspO [Balneolaceae bacterium]|tara:strand:+ start:1073 stop:1549 length:477 start_codon:yes stop_codon:yes gene_type:complete
MKIPFWAKILFGILICNAVGLAASTVTIPAISEWYVTLNKPSFNPPDWLFGPVWTLLYTLMGISAAAVWQAGTHKPEVVQALQFFGLQLLFNGLWSFLFFGLKNPTLAFTEIICLLILIIITFLKFKPIKYWASWLLIPYILWVAFASVLNLSIVILN